MVGRLACSGDHFESGLRADFRLVYVNFHVNTLLGVDAQEGLIELFLIIENAFSPYKSVDMIEEFMNPQPEETEDRFELLMNTLGGVVGEYLDRTWVKDPYKEGHEPDEPEVDEYTIDLRK